MKCNSLYSFRAGAALLSALVISGVGLGACSDDAEPVLLEGTDPLFPGFSYDTGLVPDGASVQASFAVTADGGATVSATAIPSGDEDEPTLSGVPGSGSVGVSGKFAMEGRLVVDVSGLPSYDGPIPGIENALIEFGSSVPFDPFSIGSAVPSRADIPAANLPPIPLPGGLPGNLVLSVAEGSFVEVTMTGARACVDGSEAQYAVDLARSGTLVIQPTIEIDVPIVGSKSFEIPSFEVPLSFDPSRLAMSAPIATFGSQPDEGDHVSGACEGDIGGGGSGAGTGGTGGAGTGGDASGGSGMGGSGMGGGMACMTPEDCGGLPCVEGTCSTGGGVCQADISLGDDALNTCISATCCDALETCTFDYADVDGCNACLGNGGGARCDALVQCIDGCLNWTCDQAFYGSGDGCDCGCGTVDPDCPDATAASCEFCNAAGSCGTGDCPANIDPNNNAFCL